MSPLSLLTCGVQAVDTGVCWSVLESVHLDFALLVTEKRHISLFGSFPSRKEPELMPSAGLFAGSPARERISRVWGPDSSKSSCKLYLSHLESSFRSAHSFLLTPCQGQRDTHVDLLSLTIAQKYNKKLTSSSVTDHGSGTWLFVEFLYYNKRSGQCGNRNSNGLQMENYLMEQLSSKNVILSQSKCLWNYHFTNYFSGGKKVPTFFKIKDLEFFILYIYAFLKVIMI